ncbi:predicted protein [Chaetoceros tenuissimus]|uniref:Uncharacterized protein n=1 Tax=Chaetoceros tenuissimus TaxID=426638 RepID=A0AAD3CEN9_9STRA|nr:predicted protein [Chaetoceros tenuissimus]
MLSFSKLLLLAALLVSTGAFTVPARSNALQINSHTCYSLLQMASNKEEDLEKTIQIIMDAKTQVKEVQKKVIESQKKKSKREKVKKFLKKIIGKK